MAEHQLPKLNTGVRFPSSALVEDPGTYATDGLLGEVRLEDGHAGALQGLGALGYAEGGRLARELGGWQVISWALLLALPVLAPVTAVGLAVHPPQSPTIGAWLGLAYVSGVSMFFGFFAWYRGLAEGGVAQVSQLQLAQPVLTLAWSALLLGEPAGLLSCPTLRQQVP